MSSQWFYQAMDVEVGPLTAKELREHARACRLAAGSLVRKGADGKWVTASRVKGLFAQDPEEASRSALIDNNDRDAAQPPPPSIPESRPPREGRDPRLQACPDCEREVSRRAGQCPHCGCPLASGASGRSTFEVVFSSFVEAVRDCGFAVNSLDKQNGRILFRSGMSWFSFGQEFCFVIIDNGDGTCSGDAHHAHGQVTDWGEGKRIISQVMVRALRILEERGMKDSVR